MSRGYEVVAGIGQFAGRELRRCSYCLMDESDVDIVFDEAGRCHHCRGYERWAKKWLRYEQEGEAPLEEVLSTIKKAGKGKPYDCVIGVSGGVDSSYLAVLTKRWGLRPLAVHMDNGWNSDLAVSNIERLLKTLDIDLYTEVLNWPEFRDLQLALLRGSTPDCEIPTDHTIQAALLQALRRNGIRYLLIGSNLRTESILPKSWSRGYHDWHYLSSVHKQFGTRKLQTIPHYGISGMIHAYGVRRIRQIPVLNYTNFSREEALSVLKDEVGYRPYTHKHYESVYTRFYQGYILPKKFGFDKRKCHLSTMICSGLISREAALDELAAPLYEVAQQKQDFAFVLKKFGLSQAEFDEIMQAPPKTFHDYPNSENHWLYKYPFFLAQRLPNLGDTIREKLGLGAEDS